MSQNQVELEELIGGAEDYEQLSHYGGEVVLEYSSVLHAYTILEDGIRRLVPGSTTVVSMIDKSGPLTQWAANMTVEWFIDNFPLTAMNSGAERGALRQAFEMIRSKCPWDDIDPIYKRNLIAAPVADLAKLLNDARFNYRTISKDAKDIGHLAHSWLEGYIKGLIAGGTVRGAAMPDDAKACNCINAALAWFAKHKFRPVFSEKKLYSRKYGYAGTCDWLAYVTSCGDPECCPFDGETLVLGDFKSSRSLYDEYFCQLASYWQAIEEEFPELKIGACMLLRLGKEDGEFEVRTATQEEFDSDLDGFLGCLGMYFWQKQRDLDRRFARDAAKAVAKAEKDAIKAAEKAANAAIKAAKPKSTHKSTRRPVVREAAGGIQIEVVKPGVVCAGHIFSRG